MISINSRHKLIEKFTFLLTSSQMPSHDQKADRTPTKRPLLVRQKAVVLIPPGAPKSHELRKSTGVVTIAIQWRLFVTNF